MQAPPFPLMEQSEYASPIGILQIGIIEYALAWIGLPKVDAQNHELKKTTESPSMKQIKKALDGYFSDPLYCFNLPLFIHGTHFQKKVWQEIQTISSGETLTYSDIAARIKSHPRAIGTACRTNNIPLVIPCHRVLGKSSPGGYAGQQTGEWPPIKRWLLEHEGVTCS